MRAFIVFSYIITLTWIRASSVADVPLPECSDTAPEAQKVTIAKALPFEMIDLVLKHLPLNTLSEIAEADAHARPETRQYYKRHIFSRPFLCDYIIKNYADLNWPIGFQATVKRLDQADLLPRSDATFYRKLMSTRTINFWREPQLLSDDRTTLKAHNSMLLLEMIYTCLDAPANPLHHDFVTAAHTRNMVLGDRPGVSRSILTYVLAEPFLFANPAYQNILTPEIIPKILQVLDNVPIARALQVITAHKENFCPSPDFATRAIFGRDHYCDVISGVHCTGHSARNPQSYWQRNFIETSLRFMSNFDSSAKRRKQFICEDLIRFSSEIRGGISLTPQQLLYLLPATPTHCCAQIMLARVIDYDLQHSRLESNRSIRKDELFTLAATEAGVDNYYYSDRKKFTKTELDMFISVRDCFEDPMAMGAKILSSDSEMATEYKIFMIIKQAPRKDPPELVAEFIKFYLGIRDPRLQRIAYEAVEVRRPFQGYQSLMDYIEWVGAHKDTCALNAFHIYPFDYACRCRGLCERIHGHLDDILAKDPNFHPIRGYLAKWQTAANTLNDLQLTRASFLQLIRETRQGVKDVKKNFDLAMMMLRQPFAFYAKKLTQLTHQETDRLRATEAAVRLEKNIRDRYGIRLVGPFIDGDTREILPSRYDRCARQEDPTSPGEPHGTVDH